MERTSIQRRKPAARRKGPRHPRRDPHAENPRTGTPPGDAGRTQCSPGSPASAGGAVDFPRPGHRHATRTRLAGARRGAASAAHARRIRHGQANHVQCLLHVADRDGRHASRRWPAWASADPPRCWSPAAAAAISWPAPRRAALHRRRTRLASPAASPGPGIRSRHPHREFPGHEAAGGHPSTP